MKNRWICIFLAALLLLTAAGCGNKETQQTAEPAPPAQAEQNSAAPQTPDAADISAPQGEAADAAEAQNLRVACWGDDLGLIASRLKDFEAAHPELTVETVQYASETEFLTAMGAGKLPDVIWCGYDRSRLELLAAKGYLAELDGLREALPHPGAWRAEYRARCVNMGKAVRVLRGDEVRQARALDIDGEFGLTVAYEDGSRETVRSGEVSVRGLYGYIE